MEPKVSKNILPAGLLASFKLSTRLCFIKLHTTVLPAIKTDHAAILLGVTKINKQNQTRDPGIWKMNCSLLEEGNYVDDVALKIPVWIAQGEED